MNEFGYFHCLAYPSHDFRDDPLFSILGGSNSPTWKSSIAALCAISLFASFPLVAYSQSEISEYGLQNLFDRPSAHDHQTSGMPQELDPSPIQHEPVLHVPSAPGKPSGDVSSAMQRDLLAEEIRHLLQSSEDAHVYLDKQIASMQTAQRTIIEHLDLLSNVDFDQIRNRLNRLESKLASLTSAIAALTASDSTATSETPPFRLISVDSWQSKWNAVVAFDGSAAMIGVGESRAGWRLVEVNPTARTAKFQNRITRQISVLEVDT